MAGRAGPQPLLPTRPRSRRLWSAVCWPSCPVTHPGPRNSRQRPQWLTAPRRAWPRPGASWLLPLVWVRATRGGEHSPALRGTSFRLHVRCRAPHPSRERCMASVCGGPVLDRQVSAQCGWSPGSFVWKEEGTPQLCSAWTLRAASHFAPAFLLSSGKEGRGLYLLSLFCEVK